MIRKMEASDIEQIINLENEVLSTTLGDSILKLGLVSEMAYYYVYLLDNKVIGYISSSFDGNTIEILNFCVYKEYQNTGIGTKLLNHLIVELMKKGANNSVLEVRESNINAIKFYEKFGYKSINIRKNYYADGENAILMQKIIIPYSDLSLSYISNFTKIENHKDYISYRNDNYKIKYDYNKYEILDDNNLDKIMKKINKDNDRTFLELEIKNRHYEYFNDMVEAYCGILFNSISNIRIEKKYNDIRELDENNYHDYIEYCYIDNLSYGEEYANMDGKFRADFMLKNKDKLKSFLIYDNDKIIGVIDTYLFLDNAYIENFSILEEKRNNGYGSSLFMGMIEHLKEMGIHNIFLEVDNYDTPKEMYKKWGFSIIDNYYAYHKSLYGQN